jgi:carboxypeptidase-like protein
MAESSTHINYSFEDIQRYLQGNMSAAEMHAIEKAALQDPFLADAIEGYREVSSVTAQQHLNEIHAALQEEKQDSKIIPIKKNNQWLRIAAIIILLAGVGIIGKYFLKKSNNQNQIAQVKNNETKKQSIIKDSVETVKPETLSVNKNSVPVIAENKKKPNIHSPKNKKVSEPYISTDTNNEEQANSVASLAIHPEQNSETDRTFAPVPLSAQKNNDSTQNFLQGKASGLNVTAANTFTGKVIDENDKPVPFAIIQLNNKRQAVATDATGNFYIKGNDSALPVTISAVGYESKTSSIKSQTNNNIVLNKNNTSLNEVVVTALGNKKSNKRDEQTATPVGGWANFNNYVITKLSEDSTKENYMTNNDIVELEFLIDDDGSPYNIQITKPLDDKRNSKAVDILKSGPKWTNTSKKKKAKVAIEF